MAVTIEAVSWHGWPNCYRIRNGIIEAMVTADVGPRILFFGYEGGRNLFYVHEPDLGGCGEADFKLRGGHRIWAAPEIAPGTYYPDNEPVTIDAVGDTLTATAPPERTTGLRKAITMRMSADCASAVITHRIENTLLWPIAVSAWGLTMMSGGGVGITGFPPRGTHPEILAPTHPLVMWAFSDLSDPRWTFTKKYLVLRHDSQIATPTKLGHFNARTWGAYLLNDELFLKQYDAEPGRTYPDLGCSYETFTNGFTLELETLGPLTKLNPGCSLEHVERWKLHRSASVPNWTDDSIDALILPLL